MEGNNRWTFSDFRQAAKTCSLVVILAALMFPCMTRFVLAQANAGVTGTVTDASGAVIPGANLTITNDETKITHNAVTSNAGTFTVTGLNPGHYTVKAEAAGFKTNIQNGVNVEVSTQATINVAMSTGAATETVEVTSSGVALNTTQPQLGTTIEPEVVKALPNEVGGRGRQIDSFQFLAPGTTGDSFSHRLNGGVDFSQEVVFNGIPFPQPETEGFTTNVNPPYELVREFRVERSTFSAQFGLGQGAITYQMAPGTNNFHGDLFEINRNSFFDSVGFFNSKAQGGSGKVPTDHENNYGFTIGGPVWIPKLYNGRDRTFFHYSQEWYKQNNVNTGISTVPTALERTGDFSDYVDGQTGLLIPIYDPQTGKQFQFNGRLNVIDPARISPNSALLLPFLPNPDRPGSGAGGLDGNKNYAPFINPHIQHVWGFNIDHNFTPTQSIHYSQWRNTFSQYSFDHDPLVIKPNPLNSMKFDPTLGSGFLLSYGDAISPNLLMTAGAGWFGELNPQNNITSYSFPAVERGIYPPNISFDGQHSPTDWGTSGAWGLAQNRKLGIALVNNWLWNRGRHSFNIGGEFRRTYQDDSEQQTTGGHFNFSQRTTSGGADPGSTGSAFASYLLGQVDAANRSNSQELRLRNFDLSPYIQDDIKLTPKLTVNVGLRWDLQVPFTEVHNTVVYFDPKIPNPAAGGRLGAATKFGNCAGCAGFSRADIHWGHFGPRLGLAYMLNNKTVVQGGFSVAFLNGGAYEYGTSKVGVNYGNLLTGSFTRLSTNSSKPGFGSWDTNVLPNPTLTPFSAGLGVGTRINAFSKNDGFAPYSQQWNINVQRQLPWDLFVTAAWVGNREIHLPSQLNKPGQLDPKYLQQYGSMIDPATGTSVLASRVDAPAVVALGITSPYPSFVSDFGDGATVAQALGPYPQYSNVFNNFEGSGTAYYEGLQLQAEKRFTNGLAFLVAYTLSRTMDNTSSGFSSFANGALNKYNQKAEWAISSSDVPNNLKISGTYELPIGPGKAHANNKGLTGQVLGGWQVGWILGYQSGTPFGVNENGSPFPNGFNRPDRVSSVKLSTASYSKEKDYFLHGRTGSPVIFDKNAFQKTSSDFVLGNAQRNYSELRNPPYYNENLNVRKKFSFSERFLGILQVDYFNALNRTRFRGPDTNASSGTFGLAQSAGQDNSTRQGQVSFRLEF